MARHVAVRSESACARRVRRSRPFRGSLRPCQGPASEGGRGRACHAPAWGGPWPGRGLARGRAVGGGDGMTGLSDPQVVGRGPEAAES